MASDNQPGKFSHSDPPFQTLHPSDALVKYTKHAENEKKSVSLSAC